MPGKPNLFVIGAMKSGTTSLCRYLGDHPAIFMAPVKEPMHFSRPENWSQGHDQYLQLFADATDQTYLAEGSTEYTKRPFREGVAQRLHDFNPTARLVYVMRDPFDRLVSQYRHQALADREHGTLLEAIQRPIDYLTNSHYAYQLKPYLDLFGRDAVYLDTFESFVASPERFCARLFKWLGIDDTVVPQSIDQRLNVSPPKIEVFDEGSLKVKLWRRLKAVPGLGRLTPSAIRRWSRALMPKASARDVDSQEFQQEVDKVKRILRPMFIEWIAELTELTGCSHDNWPTVSESVEAVDATDGDTMFWLPEELDRKRR